MDGNNPFKDKYEWNYGKHFQGIDERYVPGSEFLKNAGSKAKDLLEKEQEPKASREAKKKPNIITQEGNVEPASKKGKGKDQMER